MSLEFKKPEFYFVKGYNPYLDRALPTRHLFGVCYSELNRYPLQTEYIKSMMKNSKNGALKILNIGVAQGQEPLTHINSAFELSKETNRPISDFIDLKTVDILREAPVLSPEVDKLSPEVIAHLINIYDSRSGKSIWGTPIEKFIDNMTENNEKQDVILFNNVLQHVTSRDENILFKKIDKLVKLVKDDGIFCFEISDHNLEDFEKERNIKMLSILKTNQFEEFIPNSGIYKKSVY